MQVNSLPVPLVSERLAVGVLVAAAIVVGLLLYVQRPAIERRSVFSALPWLVTGAALHAIRGSIGYPDVLLPVLQVPWVYLLTATLGGLVWTLINQFTSRESRTVVPHYFGLMGIGVTLPPTFFLIVKGGVVAPELLGIWIALPVVAVIVTYLTVLALGLWMPAPAYFAGTAGALVIFGLALEGLATALALQLGGQMASPVVLTVAAHVAQLEWVARPLAVVWAAVWLRLALGIAALAVFAAIERSRPAVAERGLELTTIVAVVVAANTFLFALSGGWIA